jgi:hypothetical protein
VKPALTGLLLRRRSFLKGAAALPLLACTPGKGVRVVVVGAGAAGLWAAQLLIDKGFSVVLLEASDRYGGRVRPDDTLADYPVELGAEEIHGENTVLYSMCEDANAAFVDADDQDWFWMQDADGNWALHDESVLESDTVLAAAATFVDEAADWTGSDVTIDERLADEGIADRARFLADAQIGNEYGSDNAHIGALSLAEEDDKWTAGAKNFGLASVSILSLIELACPDSRTIVRTGAQVTSITTAGAPEGGVRVSLSDGTTVDADYGILTVSLGVLKAGLITFDPPLSADRTAAIDGIGMGNGMKIILSFSSRFWSDDLGSLYGVPGVPELWATGLGRTANPLQLTAFVMGAPAAALSARGAAAVDDVLAALDTVYGGAATAAFVDARILDWTKEPTVLGSYSYPSPGSSGLRGDLAAVEGRLHFAGEATHTGGHFATVHGALETGERAVDEIIDRL